MRWLLIWHLDVLQTVCKWKFREMIEFRDQYAKEHGWNLIVESNMEAFNAGVGPFTHGSKVAFPYRSFRRMWPIRHRLRLRESVCRDHPRLNWQSENRSSGLPDSRLLPFRPESIHSPDSGQLRLHLPDAATCGLKKNWPEHFGWYLSVYHLCKPVLFISFCQALRNIKNNF